MKTAELLDKLLTVHGLVIVLHDILWNLSDIPKSVQRKFTGILSLSEVIEQGIVEVKKELEARVEQ